MTHLDPQTGKFLADLKRKTSASVVLELEPGARYWVEIRGLEPKGKRGDDRLAYLVEFVEG